MHRLNYYQIAPTPFGKLGEVTKYLETGAIETKLRLLVEIRVSQINGCVYCVELHSRQARDHGESQKRLDTLPVWLESPFFNDREKAALAWAESLTHVSETHAPDELYKSLLDIFTEKEIVDLSVIISLMNAWNRIAVGFRKMPDGA